jgi:vacuolar protein sorting-associated protein 45
MANTTFVSDPPILHSRILTDAYVLDFSNIIRKSSLERLAEADDHEVVRAIQEYFADYLVINPDLMSLDLGFPQHRVWGSSPDQWYPDSLQRATEGVLALLLSLKKKPLIRYEKNSLLCKKLATEVRYHITQEDQLFDFRKTDTPPILLIVDRRDDPVTPLLTQWTYQAMVHELLGIRNGRVDLSDVPDIRPELKVSTSVLRIYICVYAMLMVCRKSFFRRSKIRFSRKTCTSTSEILGRMRKTM